MVFATCVPLYYIIPSCLLKCWESYRNLEMHFLGNEVQKNAGALAS